MSREEWQRRRGSGGSLQRTLRERERFVHVAQSYHPVTKKMTTDDGDEVEVFDRYEADFRSLNGKTAKGKSFVNIARVNGRRTRQSIGRRRVRAVSEEQA